MTNEIMNPTNIARMSSDTHAGDIICSAESLRLALFTDTWLPQINGVSRTLDRLRTTVEERGGVVKVFTVDDPEAVQEDESIFRAKSIPFWAYPQLRLAWPARARVVEKLREFRPTLIHAATEFGMGLAGRAAAESLQVPLVTSYHTSFSAYAQYYKLGLLSNPGWQYLKWFHSAGGRTYCPTQSIVNEVEQHGFTNCRVWSRGVDTERFSPQYRSMEMRRNLGVSDDTLVVAYVGRMAAEKGLDWALAAMQRVAASRSGKIAFFMIGDGPYSDQVQVRTPSPCWLPGKLSGLDLSTAYASADVFLFPSSTDTFGNVMLEAMASGIPVIGANVGPTRELLGPSGGWLVPKDDVNGLVQTMEFCVDHPEVLKESSLMARSYAESCTWDRIWDALISDYLVLQRVDRVESLAG